MGKVIFNFRSGKSKAISPVLAKILEEKELGSVKELKPKSNKMDKKVNKRVTK